VSILEGVNVLDFSWVAAGPVHTKCLADFGATVVRIESLGRPDVLRYSAPYKDGKPGINRSGYYAIYNTNKYSMGLNLKHPKGLELIKRLVKWADVVAENFTPGTMEDWGLGYDDLKKIRPDIIMLRTTQQGATGPNARQPGYGPFLTAFAGFSSITGWPDRPPLTPAGAHPDFVAPRLGLSVLIAALMHRKKTGKGQCLDVSQLECSIQFLSPLILSYCVNGEMPARKGNSSSYAPCNAYPCKGTDRWCAIVVQSDDEWQQFCQTMGDPGWTKEDWCQTLLGRKANEQQLDALVSEWTINLEAGKLMELLQNHGIAAGVVKNSVDLIEDPQLNRDYFWWMDHPDLGKFPYPRYAFKLSRTPDEARMPSPCLGEHTEYVCQQILKLSDEAFIEYLNEGVFS